MKLATRLLALPVGLLLGLQPARADVVDWHNVPAGFLKTGIERLTGKGVEIEPSLAGRMFTIVSPKDMAADELIYFARGVLAVDGVMWTETESTIKLTSYLSLDQVAAVRKSLGVTPQEERPRRRSVVLSPEYKKLLEELAEQLEEEPEGEPHKRRTVVLPSREEEGEDAPE